MKKLWFILADNNEYKNIEAVFEKLEKEGNPIERVESPTIGMTEFTGDIDSTVKVYLFKCTEAQYSMICRASKTGATQLHW